jgi:GAF domain-containing protein
MPLGSGLSGRVYETKMPMRLQNYHAWEGQASAFADVPMKAALSIPLLYDDNVVGVLTAGELKPGRVFSDRDQAMLQMLAPQAAVAIVNAQLRQQIAALQPKQPSSQPA